MFFSAVAFALVLAQQPAPAAQQPSQPSNPVTQAEAEEEARLNEVVCRREHVVGSNRPQRICQTRRQWNALRDRSLEDMNGSRNRTVESHLPTAGAGR
ncbi:MAG TPA: hypothetical protein PLE81_08680 [Brevundimonas sp.]|jgi:hypothetical protein|uniref:hypothetical protein n=1 Tax=Brevundimonas sp. TaxID=1871086 RepID=UPI002B536FF5|nr:hypothetical protein [Brevundimonas sp.]HRH20696.1 hypothetical protein [Brevundimonas sp.]